MKKGKFLKLVKEAEEEFKEEQDDRVKTIIKERLREYEMAKATCSRIEKGFEKLKLKGYKNIDDLYF